MGSTAGRNSLVRIGLALVAAALLAMPATATGQELTRAEYVERLEPICKANANANARILKGVKGQVQKGQLVPAGKRFVRASRALGRSVNQMARVPRPSADAPRLKTWFTLLNRQRDFLRKIGQALQAKNKFRAQKLAVQLNRNNNRANNSVISFGFKHCRIDSSKFI